MIAGTIMQNQNMETMLKTLLHGYGQVHSTPII